MGSPKPITQADNMQAPPVMNPIQYSMPGQAAANAAPLQPAHQNPPAAPAGQPVSYGAPAPQSFMMPGQPTGQPSQGFTPYKN